MIQLLYTLLVGEGFVVLLLILKNPTRKIITTCLDRAKRGRGPVIIKTLVGILFVLMVSNLHGIVKIQRRSVEFGAITPTDQVLMSKNMLESSLIGFCIFLALIIDRMHHYIREIRMMRKTTEPLKKQGSCNDGNDDRSMETIKREKEKSALREKQLSALMEKEKERADLLEKQLSALMEKVRHLQREVEAKEKEARTAEASVMALKKQSDGFLLEYDRLLEDNQNLRSQLQSFDRRFSHSNSKKTL